MAFIDWSDDFSVGVAEIDEEHRQFIGMINALHAAIINQEQEGVTKQIVVQLIGYASNHFAMEEKYMEQFNYPGFLAHKIAHEGFAQKTERLLVRAGWSGDVIALEVLNVLKSWLEDHILGTDKQYTKCFNENGLK